MTKGRAVSLPKAVRKWTTEVKWGDTFVGKKGQGMLHREVVHCTRKQEVNKKKTWLLEISKTRNQEIWVPGTQH